MSRPPVFSSSRYADAVTASKTSDRLLVVDATASWCQPCQVMDRTTWLDARVVEWLEQNAVAVQIDVDEEEELARALGVRAMPTVIALRRGVEVDRVIGLKNPPDLLAWLQGVSRGETHLDHLRNEAGSRPGDMKARFSLARTLAERGRLDEATDEYVWLWQHMLEFEPALVGVRGSYLLSDAEQLTKRHPPARTRFVELRDALGVRGPPSAAPREAVRDWIALSVMLGESDGVLAWFDSRPTLLDERPELEGALRLRLVPLLVERARWSDIGRLFRDPLAALRQSYERLQEAKGRTLPGEMPEMRPKRLEALESMTRQDAVRLVVSLFAAGREPEARTVLDELRQLMPDAETERVLLETATTAGVRLS
jgi:thiol-disulfide isomerase/thioredoxin